MALQAHLPQVAEVIQLAIAPVFMLTALGAIISALNMRLGRAVDLSRTIAAMFVAAMLALIACLLLFLREIFIAVSTPRHVPGAGQ